MVSDTTTSVAIAPAFVPALPNTHWLLPVAVASRPKINEPLKLPDDVLYPTDVLLLPDVLAVKQDVPTAVLFTPVVFAAKEK